MKKSNFSIPITSGHTFLLQSDNGYATVYPHFNPNPETGTSLATFFIYRSDINQIPKSEAACWRLDYDYETDKTDRFWSSCGCECQREASAEALSGNREKFASFHRRETEQAKAKLKRAVFPKELLTGAVIAYGDLIPGYPPDQTDHVAGMILIHNDQRWWVSDMYCANPECRCNETLLDFRLIDNAGNICPMFAVDYYVKKPHQIREVDEKLISMSEAESVMKTWIERKPVWYTEKEIQSRGRQLKQVMTRTLQRTAKSDRNESQAKSPVKVGRNDPCICGSGKKHKHCCMKKL